MKKLLLFAVVAGLGLVSASPPKGPEPERREARGDYPPCSRTVTDRCNQLRGHGRHHAEHPGHREYHAHRGDHAHRGQHAHREHRYASRGGGHAVRAPAAAHRRVARVRRAGERG